MSAKVDARKVMAELRRLRERAPEVVERGVGVWAESLTGEMKHEDVIPFKSGTLSRSHGWSWVSKGRSLVVRLFANTVYAAAVHETHKTKPRWFARTLETEALPALEKAVQRIKKELGT